MLLDASAVATLALGSACGIGWAAPDWLRHAFVLPALLFVLMVAYQGVRLGRSTRLVDMADEDERATYTPLSNTAIGLLLVLGSAFGFVAEAYGEAALLGVFAAMCATAGVVAIGLREVQE